MMGIKKLQDWLIINQAMKGSIRQKTPNTNELAIIDRDRVLTPRNSPR
jgi:hypothetical protein